MVSLELQIQHAFKLMMLHQAFDDGCWGILLSDLGHLASSLP